jgi:hypothetical protein
MWLAYWIGWQKSLAAKPELLALLLKHFANGIFFAQLYNCERGRFDSSKSPCA